MADSINKDSFTALKKILALTQTDGTMTELCAELSRFTGGGVLVTDSRGRVMAHSGTHAVLKQKESVDGQYIDSRIADRLLGVTELITLHDLSEPHFKNITEQDYCAAILPIFTDAERAATMILSHEQPLLPEDMDLLLTVGAVITLIVRNLRVMETSGRQRNIDAVKLAIGTLSYSELAAVLHVFHELGGTEGLLVAGRIADSLGITRSIVVNALRKLEGAGVIETRSLGMKGTYIKVLNDRLLEELYKIRK